MLLTDIDNNIRKNLPLFRKLRESTLYSLIGCASKKMRGITFNYDHEINSIETIMIFDAELTEDEDEAMQLANTEVFSDLHHEITGDFILTLIVVSHGESILDKCGNWGWIYLRKEYE